MRATAAVFVLTLTALAACSDRATTPTGFGLSASRSGVPFASGLASPVWQVMAAAKVSQANFAPPNAGHAYGLLGVAQYLAVQEAEGSADFGGGRSQFELDRGAVAGASAAVLTYLFPTQAQSFEDLVAAQATAGPAGLPHPAFTRGEAIGRAVGAAIVTRAQGDGFNTPFSGTIPSGPGLWVSNTTPPTIAGGQLPTALAWFLNSPSQFRPGPPPAFGSAGFLAGLAEIRTLSDTRTAEQTAIAAYWALNAGTPTATGFWIQVGTDGIIANGFSEREATHLYALLGATMYDAFIACWDAKQTYWYIRPWRADAAITTTAAVGRPNHPSYPSGHSCISSSGAEVLSAFFPDQRAHLDAMVTEAGLSRMYGGIHYRFDIEAGQTLGRSLARFTVAADAAGNSVLTPH
jgi:membrane-associated phospholipid phosphatase